MAREGLQMPLRTAVRKVLDTGQEVTTAARVRRDNALHPVRLVVRPLKTWHDGPQRLLVTFFERDVAAGSATSEEIAAEVGEETLQAELNTAREDLRLTIEQMEAANEELKASNEEIRSINEELQASNEELETSKEELQSLNEELNTVNNQLQAKVGELEARTDDLNNLLNSTDVATLFLDRALCIRWFTPTMKTLLELRATDIGRPISHFAQRFSGGDLLEDAREVLARLRASDAEVVDDLGRWYIRHIVPYRTASDRIDGVVVTFTNITERKHSEEELQRSKDFAEGIVDSVPMALLVLTPTLKVHATNDTFCELFEVKREEVVGRLLFDLGNREWSVPELRRQLEEVLPRDKQLASFEVEGNFPKIGRRIMLLHARRHDAVQLILLSIQDITERKEAEQEKDLLAQELSHRVKNTLAVVQSLATQTDGRARSVEAYREAFVGRLQALARAQNLLLEAHWRGTNLKALVEQAVAAYRVDHPEVIEIEGEPVPIAPRQGLGLSLILHELGTNAAKHGALTRSEGRLHISWQVQAASDRRVRLRWQERHGPMVEPPAARGFGTRLIERACEYELGGEVELEYAPDGLSCELVFPVG
jgi:two-component system CheB/CheR fusion protein